MFNLDTRNPPEWTTIPKTQFKYVCKQDAVNRNDNFYFDYTVDPTKPSSYFTNNIKEIIIECNEDGYVLKYFSLYQKFCKFIFW